MRRLHQSRLISVECLLVYRVPLSHRSAMRYALRYTLCCDNEQLSHPSFVHPQAAAIAALSAKVDKSSASSSDTPREEGGGADALPSFTLASFGDSLSPDTVRRAASTLGIPSEDKPPGVLGSGSYGTVLLGSLYSGTVPVAVKVRSYSPSIRCRWLTWSSTLRAL